MAYNSKMKKQILSEEFRRMQKLAGIITENITLTPQQEQEFLERIENIINDEDFEYAFHEAGNILANIITGGEAEFIENVENFGYNPDEVEDYAQKLLGGTDLENIESKDIKGEIQKYLERGSRGDLYLNKYKGETLPPNFPEVERDLVLNNSSITSLPGDLSVGGTLFLVNTPISKKYSRKELQRMLPRVNNFYI